MEEPLSRKGHRCIHAEEIADNDQSHHVRRFREKKTKRARYIAGDIQRKKEAVVDENWITAKTEEM